MDGTRYLEPELAHLVVMNLPDSEDRLLGIEAVVKLTSLSKSTIHEMRADGAFPKGWKFKNGRPKRRVWWLSEIKAWLAEALEPDEEPRPKRLGTHQR